MSSRKVIHMKRNPEKMIVCFLPLLLAACFLCSPLLTHAATSAKISIVVDPGRFATAEKAAFAEAEVDWWDEATEDDAACTESYAAVELRNYLCKLTGRKPDDGNAFPIVSGRALPPGDAIVVGRLADELFAAASAGNAPALGRDGFRIRKISRDGRNLLLIAGGSRIGTLYGVYGFLQKLGVRWFAPGESGESIPRISLARLPDLNESDKPSFYTRGFWAWENRGNDDFFDWMARNRLNLWNTAEGNHPRLKKLGMILTCGGHSHIDWFIGPQKEYPYNHPQFPGDESRVPDPYPVSPYFKGDVNGNGKLEYSEAHPEWYGLINGVRDFDIRDAFGVNYCTSNDDATRELLRGVVGALIGGEEGKRYAPQLAVAEKKPWEDDHWRHAESINFWVLDYGKWCECDRCKALGIPTDRNLRLVHQLRTEMEKATKAGLLKRNVQIAFLAYADVVDPPTRPLPEGFDYENCIATFFPIDRCYVHRFDDPACTEINVPYFNRYRGWALDPKRFYRGQIFIGEYYNISGFKGLPIVFSKSMTSDIPYYCGTSARHFHYMHVTTRNWGTRALTNYQMARMLWAPAVDVPALTDEYFTGRYGAAARAMRECYHALEQSLVNVKCLKYNLREALKKDDAELFPLKHMRYERFTPPTDDGPDLLEMVGSIDEAMKRVDRAAAVPGLSPAIKARIGEDRSNMAYAWNTIHFYERIVRTVLSKRLGRIDEAKKAFSEAVRLADVMKRDTVSCRNSSTHANADDTFQATMITDVYDRLAAELGFAGSGK